MTRNVNDGTANPPRLRVDIHAGNLWLLPEWSTGPTGSQREVMAAVKAAGFEGVQGGDPQKCAEAGLACTAFGLVRNDEGTSTEDLAGMAKVWADAGNQCCTLHVGNGFEDDEEADRMIEAVLEASEQSGLPLYVETHRATITQDPWRTVQLAGRHPELRFNADLSHWYTGLEWTYGNVEPKRAAIGPVLDRVSFMHGRIGSPGRIQVDVGEDAGHPSVGEFRALWTSAMAGFQRGAGPGDVLIFAPELLPAVIDYALEIPGPDGTPREEGDRWAQAQVLARIARECWAAAEVQVTLGA